MMLGAASAKRSANDAQCGLTGYRWTSDVTRALRFTDQLEAVIWVNSENVRHLPTPFGSVKGSGIGRDGSDWSFDFYMESKNVPLRRANTPSRNLAVKPQAYVALREGWGFCPTPSLCLHVYNH